MSGKPGTTVCALCLQVITYAESEVVDDDSYLMDLGPRCDFNAQGEKLPEGKWDKE